MLFCMIELVENILIKKMLKNILVKKDGRINGYSNNAFYI